MFRLIATVSLFCMSCAPAFAQSPLAACEGVAEAKSRSRVLLEGKTLMTHLLMLESRGETQFHPSFSAPASQCVFEEFDVGGSKVKAIYSPLEKGPQTLQWKFSTAGDDPREVLVLYDGMASLIAKKDVFLVVEERNGVISFYGMYRDPPTLAVLKPQIGKIMAGSAAPLAAVRWPSGAAEPLIEAYSDKLK